MLLALLAVGQFAPIPGKKPPATAPRVAPPPAAAPTSVTRWQPTLLWRTSVRRGEATAAIGKEGAFVAGGSMVHHFNKEGRTNWATEIGTTYAEAVLVGSRVLVGSERGTLYALDRQNGQVLWKTVLGNAVRMAPLVVGELVVVECLDGQIYGLELATGVLKWKFVRPDGSLGYAAPALGPMESVLVCGESTVYRLSASSGRELWRTAVGGKALGTPAVVGNRVYVAGDGAGVVALDLETGERRWRFRVEDDKIGPDWFSAPLVVGKMLYVSTYRRNVYALDAATGKVKWSTKITGSALAPPVLDEKRGVLYLSSVTSREKPSLVALNARTGIQLWDYKLGSLMAAPALFDGRLYLASTNGYFYAFSIH